MNAQHSYVDLFQIMEEFINVKDGSIGFFVFFNNILNNFNYYCKKLLNYKVKMIINIIVRD